jgi:hypothetical protein
VHGPIQSTVALPSCFSLLAANRTPYFSLSCQNRWLVIEFIPATSTPGQAVAISGKDDFHALKQSVLLRFGDVGWGEVGASLAGEIVSVFCSAGSAMGADLVGGGEQSQVFLTCDESLHRTRCARPCNKHDLGSARVAG